MTYEVPAFLYKCVATLDDFQEEEKQKYPENQLLYRSALDIMRDFNFELDAVKRDLEIIPDEVYISFFDNGSLAVNMGETLLKLRIDFQLSIDVRSASRLNRRWGKTFSYEHEFCQEYNRCRRQYNHFLAELKQAHNARDCSYGELMQAMDYVTRAQSEALVRLSTMGSLGSLGSPRLTQRYRRGTTAQIDNMQLILTRLKRTAGRRG
jgi:hypothetical protein